MSDQYSDEEWGQAVDGRPLSALSEERFMTLHRHWIWADSAFSWFKRQIRDSAPANGDIDLASDRSFSMYLWYSMLWSVIEGVQKHPVVLRGEFRDDVRAVRDPLREAWNAVMHVSDEAYYDDRLFLIMTQPESALVVRRVHHSFSRLFLEELRARRHARESDSG